MNKIFLIGAGLTNLTLARKLADYKIHSVIIEQRSKIGGNCSCHYDNSIEIHEYGPHIFHTSNAEVIEFMKRFTEFNQFKLNVISEVNGKKYHLPFNLDLINSFFNVNLDPCQVEDFLNKKRIHIDDPKNLEEQALSLIGKEIYETFIKGYTKKQWHKDPKDLPASIIKRIPVRNTYDNNYYDDSFQGIPLKGYQNLFENMINSDFIDLKLNEEFKLSGIKDDCIYVYSGQIDKLLDYRLGKLEWRSLVFEHEKLDVKDWQGTAVINYPSEEVPYTRVHEYKHFHPETLKCSGDCTCICREYPTNYDGSNEPYYPVNTLDNINLHAKYVKLLNETHPNVKLCGRLSQYKYFDMDDAVAEALKFADILLQEL